MSEFGNDFNFKFMEKKLIFSLKPRMWVFAGFASFLVMMLFSGLNRVGTISAETATPLTNRDDDPIIITGTDLPYLLNARPDQIVGYKFVDGWEQIPIQIDERKQINLADPYGPVATMFGSRTSILTYADDGTYVGADDNPAFDENDELVFMAKDSGNQINDTIEPEGTLPESGMAVRIDDPINETRGYIYLFLLSESNSREIETSYVDYQFALEAGEYPAQYILLDGLNPENSTISTASYTQKFSDRWVMDGLSIHSGSASGVDILDRYAFQLTPDTCIRSEVVFSEMEGAFLINKNGPIRAIRSYIGAASGPHTQRTHLFYENRQDIITNLRVHAIPGAMDFMDYSENAIGMTYFNNHNLDGYLIDGNPESLASTEAPTWEMITGAQGSLISVNTFETDIETLQLQAYYEDDAQSPSTLQCAGDGSAYGASGIWTDSVIPCTDSEAAGCSNGTATLTAKKTFFYDQPNVTIETATRLATQTETPLEVSSFGWTDEVVNVEMLSQEAGSQVNPMSLIPLLILLLLSVSLAIIKKK